MIENLVETKKRPPNEQFIAGGQILTNIEDYSLRVRSEADAYAKNVKQEADNFKAQIEKEAEDAVQKKLAAGGQAAEMLAKAKEESEIILKKAQTEGYEKGYSEAEKNFKKEISQKISGLEELLKSISRHREELFLKYEKELLSISMVMAKKIVAAELKSNPDMVMAALRRVFKKIDAPFKIKVYLSPTDYEYINKRSSQISQYLDGKNNLTIHADAGVTAGNSKIESEFSEIEINIKKQLQQAEQQIENAANERKNLLSTP